MFEFCSGNDCSSTKASKERQASLCTRGTCVPVLPYQGSAKLDGRQRMRNVSLWRSSLLIGRIRIASRAAARFSDDISYTDAQRDGNVQRDAFHAAKTGDAPALAQHPKKVCRRKKNVVAILVAQRQTQKQFRSAP